MKITVITAVYNNKEMVSRAIDSVLRQRNVDVEYIVVDGSSTDGTLDVINKYADKIDIVVSGRDGGIYEALNKGLSLATGDYVGFLHSDDFFSHDYALFELFADVAPDVGAVYGDLEYVDRFNPSKIIRRWKSCHFAPELVKKAWTPPHPSLYVRRDVFNSLRGFDCKFRICADAHFMYRLFLQESLSFKYMPVVVVKMRAGGASNNGLINIFRKYREQLLIARALRLGGHLFVIQKMSSKIVQFF